ncbi:hypothetical protein AVEN_258841-1 [Araneus ventricosus]|uniref:Uncharacterized protein n=1 Tax=Araneus ventricosus TaxID=182803 RepID=A0A4Y2VND4_ARAVE|nr:hypothetical protein AVEN_258841-1 [Araneus ventricosus]
MAPIYISLSRLDCPGARNFGEFQTYAPLVSLSAIKAQSTKAFADCQLPVDQSACPVITQQLSSVSYWQHLCGQSMELYLSMAFQLFVNKLALHYPKSVWTATP